MSQQQSELPFTEARALDSIEDAQLLVDQADDALEDNKERGKVLKLELGTARRMLREAIRESATRRREMRPSFRVLSQFVGDRHETTAGDPQ